MSDPIINPNLEWDEENQVFRGKFIVGQDNDVVFKVKNDLSTNESDETFNISLQNVNEDDSDTITGNPVRDDSVTQLDVTIKDTSYKPLYQVISTSSLVDEGQSFDISLITRDVPINSQVPFNFYSGYHAGSSSYMSSTIIGNGISGFSLDDFESINPPLSSLIEIRKSYSRYRILMTRSHYTSNNSAAYTRMQLLEVELNNDANQNILREGGYAYSTRASTTDLLNTSQGTPQDGLYSQNAYGWNNDFVNYPGYSNGTHWYEWLFNSEVNLKTLKIYGQTYMRDWKFQGSNSSQNLYADDAIWEDISDFVDYPWHNQRDWSINVSEHNPTWDTINTPAYIYTEGFFTVGTTNSITFNVKDDLSIGEGNETFNLKLTNIGDDNIDEITGNPVNVNSILEVDVIIKDTSYIPLYQVTTSDSEVDEGDSFTVTLTTGTDTPDGTEVHFTVSGVSLDDFDNPPLDGNMKGKFVVGTTDSITFNVKDDLSSGEGTETFKLTLDNIDDNNFDTITGNPVNVNSIPEVDVTIKDTSFVPLYQVISSSPLVNEGQSFTVSLVTQDVPVNTQVNWTISGVSLDDFDPPLSFSSGNFIVGSVESITFNVKDDLSTGEGEETFNLRLTNIGGDNIDTITGNPVNVNSIPEVDVTIKDTSFVPLYQVESYPSSVNEGQSFTVSLVTQDVPVNTSVPFTVSGVSLDDFDTHPLDSNLDGNFIVGSVESITFQVKNDLSIDEGGETFNLKLDNIDNNNFDSITGKTVHSNSIKEVDVTISDTSYSPLYQVTTDNNSVDEGDSFTVTLTTGTDTPDGTEVFFTVSGVSLDDFDNPPLDGNMKGKFVVGTTDSITFNVKDDISIEEGTETFNLKLDNIDNNNFDIITGNLVRDGSVKEVDVTISDTSFSPLYEVTTNKNSVNEGDFFTITLTTGNDTPDGTEVFFTVSGVSQDDFVNPPLDDNMKGKFVVGTTNSITFHVKDDLSTGEGTETFNLKLDNIDNNNFDSITGNPVRSGSVKEVNVTISDTSFSPLYQVTSYPSSVNEGQSFTVSLVTQEVPVNTSVHFTVSGVSLDDFDNPPLDGNMEGKFVVGTTDSITFNVKDDLSSGEGTETFKLTLDNIDDNFDIITGQPIRDGSVKEVDVVISDTSFSPLYHLTSSSSSVNEGDSFTVSLATQHVPINSHVPFTISGVSKDDLSPTPVAYSRYRIYSTDSYYDMGSYRNSNIKLNEVELINSSNQNVLREGGYLLSVNYSSIFNSNSGQESWFAEGVYDGYIPSEGPTIYYNGSWWPKYFQSDEDMYGVSWFEFQLSEEIYLHKLRNYGETYLKDWKFQGSNDGVTWEDILDFTGYPHRTDDDGWDEIDLFEKVTSLSDHFIVGSKESITFNVRNDFSFEEGEETLNLKLDNIDQNGYDSVIGQNVNVNSISELDITISDSSIFEYISITNDAVNNTITEGQSITFTLNGSNMVSGEFPTTGEASDAEFWSDYDHTQLYWEIVPHFHTLDYLPNYVSTQFLVENETSQTITTIVTQDDNNENNYLYGYSSFRIIVYRIKTPLPGVTVKDELVRSDIIYVLDDEYNTAGYTEITNNTVNNTITEGESITFTLNGFNMKSYGDNSLHWEIINEGGSTYVVNSIFNGNLNSTSSNSGQFTVNSENLQNICDVQILDDAIPNNSSRTISIQVKDDNGNVLLTSDTITINDNETLEYISITNDAVNNTITEGESITFTLNGSWMKSLGHNSLTWEVINLNIVGMGAISETSGTFNVDYEESQVIDTITWIDDDGDSGETSGNFQIRVLDPNENVLCVSDVVNVLNDDKYAFYFNVTPNYVAFQDLSNFNRLTHYEGDEVTFTLNGSNMIIAEKYRQGGVLEPKPTNFKWQLHPQDNPHNLPINSLSGTFSNIDSDTSTEIVKLTLSLGSDLVYNDVVGDPIYSYRMIIYDADTDSPVGASSSLIFVLPDSSISQGFDPNASGYQYGITSVWVREGNQFDPGWVRVYGSNMTAGPCTIHYFQYGNQVKISNINISGNGYNTDDQGNTYIGFPITGEFSEWQLRDRNNRVIWVGIEGVQSSASYGSRP